MECFYQEISFDLENEDLGKVFFDRFIECFGVRFVDFEDFGKNDFYVVIEFIYKNGEDEFRLDIICLVNGLFLVFIEVKKFNNRNGVIVECDWINWWFWNKCFWKFVNIIQFMIFFNNMDYDDNEIEFWQGVYYVLFFYYKFIFNYFREEIGFNLF